MTFQASVSFIALAALTSSHHSGDPAQDPSATKQEKWTQTELEDVTARIRADIQRIREREFARPVAVHMTDKEGFVKYAKERLERTLTEADMTIEEEIAKLLFLVPPTMDLWGKTFEVLEEQVGGFYDPQTDAFYLMESFTGKVAEIIISHELTHALDDQLFGIDAGFEATKDDADAAQAYASVVEGSGTIVMMRWTMDHMSELSMEDLAQSGGIGTESLEGAPPYVWKPLMSAYLSGQGFLQRGYRVRKREGKTLSDVIEEAFRTPPASTEQVLHPDKYWKADSLDVPRRIARDVEPLPEGWELRSDRVIGELGLALVAASPREREPVDLENQLMMAMMKYTNDAAESWGGDSCALLARGEARVVHGVTLWDSTEDATEFAAALEVIAADWRAALAALDPEGVGHGLRMLPAPADDAVCFVAWSKAPEPDVEALLATLKWREREKEPREDEGGESGR